MYIGPDHVPPGPVVGPPARPDTPASHVPHVPQIEDPLANVKIPCYGDQLTRVRLAGAKDLRAGFHTRQDRLDHLYPLKIVDWYSKRSFLKVKHHINVFVCLLFCGERGPCFQAFVAVVFSCYW